MQACITSQTDEAAADRLRKAYSHMSPIAYAILNGASCVVAFAANFAVMQLLVFHVGLIGRGMTTYEFIIAQARASTHRPSAWLSPAHPASPQRGSSWRVAQRQKKKERDARADGGKPPSACEKCMFEAQNQAPCFAVCELCTESPATRRVDATTTTRTSAVPGRVRPAATEAPAASYGRAHPDKYVPRGGSQGARLTSCSQMAAARPVLSAVGGSVAKGGTDGGCTRSGHPGNSIESTKGQRE